MSGRGHSVILIAALAILLQAQVTPRIINGKPVEVGQYPFVIALKVNSALRCTGTAISPHIILTAAHCIAGEDFSSIQFKYETGEVVSDHADNGAVDICGGVYPKEDATLPYDPKSYLHDVGLLFTQSIIAGPYASLPDNVLSWKKIVGTSPDFIGYGLNVRPKATSETPTEMSLRFQAEALDAKPSASHTKSYANIEIEQADDWKFYYTSNLQDSKSPTTCNGDSGGPTLQGDVIIGVTSAGDTGCTVGSSTRIDAHLDWIRSHLDDEQKVASCRPAKDAT